MPDGSPKYVDETVLASIADIADIFTPIEAVRQDIHAKAARALEQLQSDPKADLSSYQSEIGQFFEVFCQRIESAGRELFKSLDERCASIKESKKKIKVIDTGLRNRESQLNAKALDVVKGQFPTHSPVYQPCLPYALNYESIYNHFPPGAKIRTNVMTNFGSGEDTDASDLVIVIGEEGRSRFFDDIDDFMDTEGMIACEIFFGEGHLQKAEISASTADDGDDQSESKTEKSDEKEDKKRRKESHKPRKSTSGEKKSKKSKKDKEEKKKSKKDKKSKKEKK